jgi:subtilisin family serine protease
MTRRGVLCLALAILLLAPAGARADDLTGRLLVTLQPDASARASAAALAGAAVRRSGPSVPELDLVTARPAPGTSARQAVRALRGRPGVRSVALERRAHLRFVPNDPALTGPELAAGTPAGTPVQWWARRTNLFPAWDAVRGAEATVAVIDTGIDPAHPELTGRIAGTFEDGLPSAGTSDTNGHGTHVASLACGTGGNGIAIVGAGFGCRLLIFKSDLSDSSIAASIVEAANRGAQAINMSFGFDGDQAPPQAIVAALDYAVSRNVVLVAAAADEPTDGDQGDPANVLQPTGSAPDLASARIRGLSVTAANFADRRASFAGSGTQVSMAGYGQFMDRTGPRGILGAFPANTVELETGRSSGRQCRCRAPFANDQRYAYLSGTSMAAPMVAGVAALLREANPDLGALEVVRMLKEFATRPAGTGWSPDLGWGILNAGAAMNAALSVDRRPPGSWARGAARVRRARVVTLRWKGSDVAAGRARPAGIAHYTVYRSVNRGPFRRLLTTRHTKARVRVRRGSRYRFYTIATDRSGNREAAPRRPDLTMRVLRRRR